MESIESSIPGQSEAEEKHCRSCGAVLHGDTYGDRCEDCFANSLRTSGEKGMNPKMDRALKNAGPRRKGATKGQQ